MIILNKKLVYIFVVLVAGLFAVSACQSEIGGRINKNIVDSGRIAEVENQQVKNFDNEEVTVDKLWAINCYYSHNIGMWHCTIDCGFKNEEGINIYGSSNNLDKNEAIRGHMISVLMLTQVVLLGVGGINSFPKPLFILVLINLLWI